MPTINISDENYKMLQEIIKRGFHFPVMIDNSFNAPKTVDTVLRGLFTIADDEGYIYLDWTE